jgi:ribosomal protein S18 acetylase RimI-like enzyme
VLGRIAARVAGVPRVVNTVHGLYATPEDRLRRRAPVLAAEWLAARCSDLELYQSAEDLRWARKLRLARPGHALHLGNGIDLAAFAPGRADAERIRALRAELGLGEDTVVVGTVGRMVREKGYEELFAAARTVRARAPDVRFLAVGQADADKADAITMEQVDRARADVVFAGWREDVADLMSLMDVFVLPSWREGLPRSAIEAAASGLPLVLTDIRGCREVVRDGVEGFLVPVGDPARLAAAILELVQDPILAKRMSVVARERAEASFDERRVTSMVVGVTGRLLGAPAWRSTIEGQDVRLRPARAADAAAMASLHREALPTAFLPTLGGGFLRRLYASMIRDPGVITIVAEERGQVVGFAAAAVSVQAFYRRFARRDGVAAGLAASTQLLRRSVLRRAIETARHPSGGADGLPDAELLSIAVEGSRRSSGVGTGLATAVGRELGRRGVRECRVIVGADNPVGNRFYERLGCDRRGGTTVHQGEASNVWVMACPS